MIELGFRNINNDIKYITIKPDNTELANVWQSQLDRLLETHQRKIFQKNFSLLGVHNNNRTVDHICNDLDRSIATINYYSDYKIINNFGALRNENNQQLLNDLHHHFETMQGQLWNPGNELAKANGHTRLAICYLNHCCHELEAWYETTDIEADGYRNGYFYYNLLGIQERIELEPKFKKQFTKNVEDGMVYLHYAQTGKTWYEAYLDNDDVVTADGISEHRVISGEFNCYFGTGYELPSDNKFTTWLESKGVDPEDEQLALGYAPVGKIQNLPDLEAQEFFKEYTDFYSIEFNHKRIEYDFRHDDESYINLLTEIWDKYGQ